MRTKRIGDETIFLNPGTREIVAILVTQSRLPLGT